MSRKLVSYRLADDLQQALKERASLEGISATELVNRLLRQGLTSQDTPLTHNRDTFVTFRAGYAPIRRAESRALTMPKLFARYHQGLATGYKKSKKKN